MKSITTLTIFRFEGVKDCYWAFTQMYFSHKYLPKVAGQTFYKLMGSGREMGFNPWPDWNTYALLQVWDKEEDAQIFFESNDYALRYLKRTKAHTTLYMRPYRSKGEWGGLNPFDQLEEKVAAESLTVVLTRARIKTNKLISFWRAVPASQSKLHKFDSLIYAKGVGEIPFIEMATISVWKNEEAINSFAYKNQSHKEVVQKTRKVGWYSEELFVRFKPYMIGGDLWKDIDTFQSMNKTRL